MAVRWCTGWPCASLDVEDARHGEALLLGLGRPGERFAIFGTGGGQRLAKTIGAPLLARIPIENAVAEGGDTGTPIALGDGAAAEAFRELAHLLSTDIAPPVDLAGCSVRLLDAVNAALDAHDSGANESDDDTKVASPAAGS